MERRETSTTIHPDQVLAKCANDQMKTRLAVLISGANDLKEPGVRIQESGGATLRSRGRRRPTTRRRERSKAASLLAPGFWLLAPLFELLLQILRQPFSQLGPRPKQDALDGRYRRPHYPGDFFVRHLLVPP